MAHSSESESSQRPEPEKKSTTALQISPVSEKLPVRRIEGSSRATAKVLAIAGSFALLYFFFNVLMLVFGAVLVAVVLHVVATPFRRLGLTGWVPLTLAALLLVVIVGATGFLFGTRLVIDLQDVICRMENAQSSIRASLEWSPTGRLLLPHLNGGNIPFTQILTSIFSISTSLIAAVIVAVIAGLYLAIQPGLYLNGLLMLFPRIERGHAEETAIAIGNALYLWLGGQFITMVLVGILFTIAALAIGLPSPLALGLIAGVFEFIPYVGPVLAAVPALMVAATQGLNPVLWTFVAYIFIHFIEGNFIAPIIQRKMVYIPPAVTVLGIAAISSIFGTYTIIFAAPICVVVFVLVKKLYVRESLKEPTPIPGEENPVLG